MLTNNYLWTAQQAFLLNLLKVIVHYFCFLYSTDVSSFLAINRYHMFKRLMGFTVLVSDVIGSQNCKTAMFESTTLHKLCGFEF